MLQISQCQYETLSKAADKRFVTTLIAHARRHFTFEIADIGDEELALRVARSIDKARDYSLVTERDIGRYLNIEITFGWEFEKQFHTRWVAEALRDESLGSPSQRLAATVSMCIEYIVGLDGP